MDSYRTRQSFALTPGNGERRRDETGGGATQGMILGIEFFDGLINVKYFMKLQMSSNVQMFKCSNANTNVDTCTFALRASFSIS